VGPLLIAASHLCQNFFSWNTPIHDPGPVGFAVLFFNCPQEISQSSFIAGVSRHHFVGQGKTVRCHNECDDNLDAIRTFITTVAKLPFPFTWWITLEIGAGQVIKQHIEFDVKQTLPSPTEIGKEILFVFDYFVKTAIELVFLHQRIICFQQIRHGAAAKPFAVQSPFTAWRNESMGHQGLQDLEPVGTFTAWLQLLCPEFVKV